MRRFLSILIAVLAVVFVACKKDSVEDILDVTTPKLIFDANSGSKSISFYTSLEWSAELTDNNDKEWCSINPSRGEAGQNFIVVKVNENSSTNNRSAAVVIKTPSLQKSVEIIQNQRNTISISQDSYTVEYQGGEIEIEVGHNIDYDITISDSWISQTRSRAFQTDAHVFTIAQNDTDDNREGTITFTSKDKAITKNVTVLQKYNSTKPRRNEIWYTTIDGNIVEPNTQQDGFGANITSNTYNNGKGVITFDGVVTKIGVTTFDKCNTLATITIPDSVKEIGNFAFGRGSTDGHLTEVVLGDGLTSIGAYAFYNCLKLSKIQLPNSLKSISHNAFRGCRSLTSITIPDSVEEIGQAAFRECNLSAFYGKFASDDKRCLISNGTLIAFADADLTSYTISENITTIGQYAFSSCSLSSITIPTSVKTIDSSAFYECRELADITIPEKVATIGENTFLGCDNLKQVYCKPSTPPTLEKNAFDTSNSAITFYVPKESVNAYRSSTSWSIFTNKIVGYNF